MRHCINQLPYYSMRKTSALLFLCLLLGTVRLQAKWSVGLEAGYNKNYLVTNPGFRAFTAYKPMTQFSFGGKKIKGTANVPTDESQAGRYRFLSKLWEKKK